MLDDSLVEIAKRAIAIALQERQPVFRREFEAVRGEFVTRGAWSSRMAQRAVDELVDRELRQRAMLAWAELARVISGQPLHLDPALTAQLKRILEAELNVGCPDIGVAYDNAN